MDTYDHTLMAIARPCKEPVLGWIILIKKGWTGPTVSTYTAPDRSSVITLLDVLVVERKLDPACCYVSDPEDGSFQEHR
jgi:hypothetical protein